MVAQIAVKELTHANFPPEANNYHKDFVDRGVAVIPGFLPSWTVDKILLQSEPLLAQAFHSRLIGNAYLSKLDHSLPAEHPYNMTQETALATIAFDEIPNGHTLRDIYLSDELKELVAAIVGEDKLYFYACPMGALNIAVMRAGDYLRWHFDQCDFVVSIPLQDATAGGHFQCVRDIRSSDSPNYDGVRQVLLGQHPDVTELKTNPGDLIVFRGRNTIHRVTTIEGEKPRLMALLSYATTPDCDSSDHLKMIRYGRIKAKSCA